MMMKRKTTKVRNKKERKRKHKEKINKEGTYPPQAANYYYRVIRVLPAFCPPTAGYRGADRFAGIFLNYLIYPRYMAKP